MPITAKVTSLPSVAEVCCWRHSAKVRNPLQILIADLDFDADLAQLLTISHYSKGYDLSKSSQSQVIVKSDSISYPANSIHRPESQQPANNACLKDTQQEAKLSLEWPTVLPHKAPSRLCTN